MCFADIYIFVLLFYFIFLLFFRFFHLFKLTFIAQPFTRQSRARETILGYTFENPNRPNTVYLPSLYELGSRRVTHKLHSKEIFRQRVSGSFDNAQMILIKLLHRNRGPNLTRFTHEFNARILLFTISNDFCILRKRLSEWLRSFWLR